MSKKDQELIAILLEESGKFSKDRAQVVSSFFESQADFIGASDGELQNVNYVSGSKVLREEEIKTIKEIRRNGALRPDRDPSQNLIAALARKFTKKQVENLKDLTLAKMNPNPFLIQSLNLSTPEEVIRLNVYAAATRSIVTSFGMSIQSILAATSDSVEKVKKGWDLFKRDGGGNHWIQVKSGPNDMDKDQIVHWKGKIEEAEKAGDNGYIGVTYGKRTNTTVTLPMFKAYLDKSGLKVLIGRELWNFLNSDPSLPDKVLDILLEEAVRVLDGKDIVGEVESCIERIRKEFIDTYGDGREGVNKYILDIF